MKAAADNSGRREPSMRCVLPFDATLPDGPARSDTIRFLTE